MDQYEYQGWKSQSTLLSGGPSNSQFIAAPSRILDVNITFMQNKEQSKSTFVSLDIEDEKETLQKQEPISKSFEEIEAKITRMRNEVQPLQLEVKQLGTTTDSHTLREDLNRRLIKLSREIDSTGNALKLISKQTFTNDYERDRLKRLAVEYSSLLDKIEALDKIVLRECKSFVQDAKIRFKETTLHTEDEENLPLINRDQDQQQSIVLTSSLQQEIDYNEGLIDERENEIQSISRASNLINELFQQIGILASEQQDLIDNIEANAENTRESTRKAAVHLDRTHQQHQRKTSRMCFYFILIIITGVFVVTLLASFI